MWQAGRLGRGLLPACNECIIRQQMHLFSRAYIPALCSEHNEHLPFHPMLLLHLIFPCFELSFKVV